MSDELRDLYEKQGLLDRFSEKKTPVNLFRGKHKNNKLDLMCPTLIGFEAKRGPRHPDVFVTDKEEGSTPQYKGKSEPKLVEEDRKLQPITNEMIKNAGDYMVKGCRSTRAGDPHRGLSLFDKTNDGLRGFEWYVIGADATIPKGLAVLRDAKPRKSPKDSPIHYTVAPKDDMPLSLFLVQLRTLGQTARKA